MLRFWVQRQTYNTWTTSLEGLNIYYTFIGRYFCSVHPLPTKVLRLAKNVQERNERDEERTRDQGP